jgi:hypothetical protein
VFTYYRPAGNRFAVVKADGEISRKSDGDTKLACAKLTVEAELTLPEFIQRAVDYVFAHAKSEDTEHATSERGAASSTGALGAASSTRHYGAASSTGARGAASSTGEYGAASSTGDYGAASSTGYQGAASSTGDYGAASSTGAYGAASSTGYQGAASSTGARGAASSTGTRGAASSTGAHAVAMACGHDGRAMAAESGAIVLVNRDPKSWAIRHIRASKVGENGIKAGVWYVLSDDGEFVEVSA